MKRLLFYSLLTVVFLQIFISCTTDDFDKEIEKNTIEEYQNPNIYAEENEVTDPIVIPKRD